MRFLTLFLLPLILLSGCGTNRVTPISHRKYRVNESTCSDVQLLNYSKSIYEPYILSLGGRSKNSFKSSRVNNIFLRLIGVTNFYLIENGHKEELKYLDWEIALVPAGGQINAQCLPGGKIIVFEGILDLAENDDGLACIIAHEIGHAICHHIAESQSKIEKKQAFQQLGVIGLAIAGVATGADTQTISDLANNTVKLSNQVMEFVEKKYSRKQEYEADYIGMMLMAMAGFNPKEAVNLWRRATQYVGDTSYRILSDHPSNKNRVKKLEQKMGEALAHYNSYMDKQRKYAKSNRSAASNGKKSNPQPNGTGSHNQSTWKVTASSLNIRNQPRTTNSTIIGSLKRNQTISVIEIVNGWAKISYNEKIGYVSAKYLTKSQ